MDLDMAPVKRSLRKERAETTRRRIAAAAFALFAEHGYQATTMSEIAREAGVAVQTVHFVFHTKAELLQEAFTRAVLGDVGPPSQQAWYRGLETQTDGRQFVRTIVENAAPILERASPLAPVIRAAPDADAAAVWAHNERLRRHDHRHMIALLAAAGWLRRDIDEERATDILLLTVGPDTFNIVVRDYGWTTDDWKKWANETLAQQLLQPASLVRPRARGN